MSFHLSIQIDPHVVLGLAPGASLHEIREAYRRKAKQHHPDTGGEEWAFRIVSQSYEVLSTARVVRATEAEFRARPSTPTDDPAARRPGAGSGGDASAGASTANAGSWAGPWSAGGAKPSAESVRPGVRDAVHDPTKVVDVEKLWVRYEVDHLWLLQDGNREDRFMSCSLNITWPEPELAGRAESIPDGAETLTKIREAFDKVHIQTPVTNSRCKLDDHRFQGWLSYANTQLAWGAFNMLHEELNARGLGVKQWTRDLIIPRDWR